MSVRKRVWTTRTGETKEAWGFLFDGNLIPGATYVIVQDDQGA